MKLRTPVEALTANFAASVAADDGIGQRGTLGVAAVTVVTAVVFSATLIDAEGAAAFDVMKGASLTSVTLTAMDWLAVRLPSDVCTMTS